MQRSDSTTARAVFTKRFMDMTDRQEARADLLATAVRRAEIIDQNAATLGVSREAYMAEALGGLLRNGTIIREDDAPERSLPFRLIERPEKKDRPWGAFLLRGPAGPLGYRSTAWVLAAYMLHDLTTGVEQVFAEQRAAGRISAEEALRKTSDRIDSLIMVCEARAVDGPNTKPAGVFAL